MSGTVSGTVSSTVIGRRALGYRFGVRGPAGGHFAAVTEGLHEDGIVPDEVLQISPSDDRWVVTVDGREVARAGSERRAQRLALSHVTRRAVRSRPSAVFLHAALVTLGDRAVLISGPSGAGKSTLCGALVDAGADYLTDEVVGLGESGVVDAWMPRPLALDGNSLRLLQAASPGGIPWPDPPPDAEDEVLVAMPTPPGHDDPIRCALVVVLDRREGPAALSPCPRSTAVARLVGHSFLPGARSQAVLDRVELLTRHADVGLLTGRGLADRRDRVLRAVG